MHRGYRLALFGGGIKSREIGLLGYRHIGIAIGIHSNTSDSPVVAELIFSSLATTKVSGVHEGRTIETNFVTKCCEHAPFRLVRIGLYHTRSSWN